MCYVAPAIFCYQEEPQGSFFIVFFRFYGLVVR